MIVRQSFGFSNGFNETTWEYLPVAESYSDFHRQIHTVSSLQREVRVLYFVEMHL